MNDSLIEYQDSSLEKMIICGDQVHELMGADGQSPADYVEPLPALLALAAASQGPVGNISCIVGYSAAVGTITPRHCPTDTAPTGQPQLTKSVK